MVLRDFKCQKCGLVFEKFSKGLRTRCPECKGHSYMTIRKIAVHGCDNFTPHYDEQVGQFFESPEHKKHILKRMGLKQTRGPLSPKKNTNMRFKMSKSQAGKFDPFMDK